MINTTIDAAYATQYAKVCKVEPRVARFDNTHEPYTYTIFDDLASFLPDDDELKDTMKDYGFELLHYDDGRLVLYTVPGHTPGGEYLANRTPYCEKLEFAESKRASEANIRNVVYAARNLVDRHIHAKELYATVFEVFNGKPLPYSELAEYVKSGIGSKHDWISQAVKKYAKHLDKKDGSNVDEGQVLRGITVLDTIRANCASTLPYVTIEPCCFRHCIEKVLKLCSDKPVAYLTNDSCAIAVAIFFEDHFLEEDIKDSLKVPAIYEVLDVLKD